MLFLIFFVDFFLYHSAFPSFFMSADSCLSREARSFRISIISPLMVSHCLNFLIQCSLSSCRALKPRRLVNVSKFSRNNFFSCDRSSELNLALFVAEPSDSASDALLLLDFPLHELVAIQHYFLLCFVQQISYKKHIHKYSCIFVFDCPCQVWQWSCF